MLLEDMGLIHVSCCVHIPHGCKFSLDHYSLLAVQMLACYYILQQYITYHSDDHTVKSLVTETCDRLCKIMLICYLINKMINRHSKNYIQNMENPPIHVGCVPLYSTVHRLSNECIAMFVLHWCTNSSVSLSFQMSRWYRYMYNPPTLTLQKTLKSSIR